MFFEIGALARQELGRMGQAHFQSLVNQVGPISEAEVDAKMPEAAVIHAREWERTSHPMDSKIPPEAHDWAVRHIAANLVARDRGYRPPVFGMPAQRPATDYELAPAGRTSDWRDR
jgi:hypothetical protein